jgi:sec-independent protein translocase protein TatC
MVEEGTIWDHVKDLRNLAIKVGLVLMLGITIGMIFNQQLIDFYLEPMKQANVNTPPHISPLGPMFFRLQVAAVTALAGSLPIIVFFLWQYISPILREKEHKFVGPYILSFLVLASIGLVYGYFMLLPQSLTFLMSYVPEGTSVLITVDEYMRFVTTIFVATVLTFQTPIVVFTLLVSRLVPKKFFDNKRKETYFIIIVVLAVITPTGDILTLGMIALPVIILFEASLILAKLFLRGQPNEEVEEVVDVKETQEAEN